MRHAALLKSQSNVIKDLRHDLPRICRREKENTTPHIERTLKFKGMMQSVLFIFKFKRKKPLAVGKKTHRRRERRFVQQSALFLKLITSHTLIADQAKRLIVKFGAFLLVRSTEILS